MSFRGRHRETFLNWLVSDVFGLRQGRSVEAERAIDAAQAFMLGDAEHNPEHLREPDDIHRELDRVLAGHDPFWPRWGGVDGAAGQRGMIRFEPVAEPANFREKATTPGTAWLAAHPDAERPKDYWTPFKGALARGFGELCAYSVMYEPGRDRRSLRKLA